MMDPLCIHLGTTGAAGPASFECLAWLMQGLGPAPGSPVPGLWPEGKVFWGSPAVLAEVI